MNGTTDPLAPQHIDRIRQRRDYLNLRIEIKQRMGWESQYDESERDAHSFVLKCFGVA